MIEYLPSVSIIIDEIGDKMQTTGVHLWEVLVKQQFILGWAYCCGSLINLFMFFIALFLIKSKIQDNTNSTWLFCLSAISLCFFILFSYLQEVL